MHTNLNLVLLGKAGVGKSATGNTILGQETFISKKSFTLVTRDLKVESVTVGDIQVTIYDTPGLFDTTMNDKEIQQRYEKVLQECESRPCVFLLVIKADRFTEKERDAVEKIEKVLGVKRIRKTWIIFTRGDELEDDNMTLEEFISDYEALNKLLQKYDQRFYVFNNKTKERKQAQELLTRILGTNCDTTDTPAVSPASIRIVLLGKTGVGKSETGNTILEQKEFRSERGMISVTSESSVKHAIVSGRSVSVVDTPGFIHSQMTTRVLIKDTARSVYLSSPGPHAFLIVLRANDRFTEQELLIPEMIEIMLGEKVFNYSIILFTHGDLIEGESVEELIQENSRLRDLVDQCGGRFHVFNNKDQSNREQVNDLLKKIDTMIEQNGGGHYSNQMFEDALRFRREEQERIQREEEKSKRQLEKQRQEEIEGVRKETEERIRAEMKTEREKTESGRKSTATD